MSDWPRDSSRALIDELIASPRLCPLSQDRVAVSPASVYRAEGFAASAADTTSHRANTFCIDV